MSSSAAARRRPFLLPLPLPFALRRLRSSGTALGIALAAAACGGGGDKDDDAAGGGAAAGSATSAAAPAQPREFDACALATEADVNAAVKKGGMAHTLAKVSKDGGGSCVYHSQDLSAKLLVEVNDFGTPDRAQQLMARHREMAAERKYPIRDVNAIGDQAAISDEGETSGFKGRKGSVVVTANLGVTLSTAAQRHPAVEELGRKIIAQLP